MEPSGTKIGVSDLGEVTAFQQKTAKKRGTFHTQEGDKEVKVLDSNASDNTRCTVHMDELENDEAAKTFAKTSGLTSKYFVLKTDEGYKKINIASLHKRLNISYTKLLPKTRKVNKLLAKLAEMEDTLEKHPVIIEGAISKKNQDKRDKIVKEQNKIRAQLEKTQEQLRTTITEAVKNKRESQDFVDETLKALSSSETSTEKKVTDINDSLKNLKTVKDPEIRKDFRTFLTTANKYMKAALKAGKKEGNEDAVTKQIEFFDRYLVGYKDSLWWKPEKPPTPQKPLPPIPELIPEQPKTRVEEVGDKVAREIQTVNDVIEPLVTCLAEKPNDKEAFQEKFTVLQTTIRSEEFDISIEIRALLEEMSQFVQDSLEKSEFDNKEIHEIIQNKNAKINRLLQKEMDTAATQDQIVDEGQLELANEIVDVSSFQEDSPIFTLHEQLNILATHTRNKKKFPLLFQDAQRQLNTLDLQEYKKELDDLYSYIQSELTKDEDQWNADDRVTKKILQTGSDILQKSFGFEM